MKRNCAIWLRGNPYRSQLLLDDCSTTDLQFTADFIRVYYLLKYYI